MTVITMVLRALQALVAVITLALAIYVANWYNTQTLSIAPHEVNFLIFAPVFTLVSIAYLEAVPRFAPRASHPYTCLGFEALNVIFYLAGFTALAVFLTKLLFCRGPVCAAARATAVFGAVEWVLWVATLVFMAKDVFKLGLRRPATLRPAMKEMA